MTRHIERDGPSRRDFLIGSAAAGAGLVMGFSVLPKITGTARDALAAGNYEPSLFVTMEPSGITTVHITKAEMGQHVGTALAQSVAEELEVDWNDVRIDYPDSHEKWGLMITGGSWSVNWTFDALSRAGASGRIALTEAGAGILGVSPDECSAANSTVTHGPSGRSVTYAEIVSSGTVSRTFTEDELKALKLKSFGEYKLVGQSVPQLDIPAKTDGSARFGIDVFVPNMVYAKLVMPPTRYGAVPQSVDDSGAQGIDGYIKTLIVEDPTGVQKGYAIALAETYWAADAAAAAVNVAWDAGPNADVSTATILGRARDLVADPEAGFAWVLEGDAEAALAGATATHEAEYITNLTYHGVMEPMNCVAMMQDGVMHCFTGNQWQNRSIAMTAEAIGVDPANVVIHQQYLGGGFGRRLEPDAMIPAALASVDVGRPVKLVYSREYDLKYDFHRSLTFQRVRGGVDDSGRYTAIDHTVCSGWATKRQAPGFLAESVDKKGRIDPFSMNGSDFWYTVPNHSVRAIENDVAQAATPPGQLRAVAPSWTMWANECFMDEMAKKIGKDPVQMRVDMLDAAGKNAGTPPNSVGGAFRLRNILETAAGKAGWGVKPLPANTGMGIASVTAQERGSPTWTCAVAEVHVDPDTHTPTVKKITIAMDVGTAVNPDGCKAQIEGSTMWGVSHALLEKATMSGGQIEQDNFDTYLVGRMENVPEMDIVLVQNGHYPAGTGEPVVTVVPAAIANAIEAASGARVREMPITPDSIKAALADA